MWCCHRRWYVGTLRVARFLAFLLQTMGWSYVVDEYMIHICRNLYLANVSCFISLVAPIDFLSSFNHDMKYLSMTWS